MSESEKAIREALKNASHSLHQLDQCYRLAKHQGITCQAACSARVARDCQSQRQALDKQVQSYILILARI